MATDVSVIADATAYRRVQQHNEARLIAKLLHDLRNPIHSVRIAIELFSRIASEGAAKGLLDKAGRYVEPAQAAALALSNQVERLGALLCPPAAAVRRTFSINDWAQDSTALLRGAAPAVDAALETTIPGDVLVTADRARLSHAALGWALTRSDGACQWRISDADGGVRLTLTATAPSNGGVAVSDEDLHRLMEAAGARIESAGAGALVVVIDKAPS